MIKKNLPLLVLTSMVLLTIVSCTKEKNELISEEIATTSQVIENAYIVVFNQQVTGNMAESFSSNPQAARNAVIAGAQEILQDNLIAAPQFDQVYTNALNGVAITLPLAEVAKLAKDKRVLFIEKDQLITLAPPPGKGPGGGDGGGSTSQSKPYGITRVNGVSTYTGSNVAWIIDSGIDIDHPDLRVDANRGFNAFTSGRDAGAPDDGNGHGTHVAGTIAALNNTIGVIGVAPGATVIPIKVLDSRGSGSYSGVIAGIDFVASNGSTGDVANMSLGGPASEALDLAVKNAAGKGIKFALAAGNESDNANNHSPARANGANIYTISAMNSTDTWASFSNFGSAIDYCAPGVGVLSTWKGGGYNSISGTSMASPHAAGVLLLGSARTDGFVKNDPDGTPDPIIVH